MVIHFTRPFLATHNFYSWLRLCARNSFDQSHWSTSVDEMANSFTGLRRSTSCCSSSRRVSSSVCGAEYRRRIMVTVTSSLGLLEQLQPSQTNNTKYILSYSLHSVARDSLQCSRHCWLGDRKGIRPVRSWVLVCRRLGDRKGIRPVRSWVLVCRR